jgi:DNA ligase 1
MKKQQKVMLAPNVEVPMDDMPFPCYASVKMDGIRVPVKDAVMYSRTWKPLSTAAHARFYKFVQAARVAGVVFDGELWSPARKFNEIMSCLAPKVVSMPDDIEYHVFDCMPIADWNRGSGGSPYNIRVADYVSWINANLPDDYLRVVPVKQFEIGNAKELQMFFDRAIGEGHEGLIVRSMDARYKHGRATAREASMFKFKKWVTVDAQIIDFDQGTRMKESVRTGDRERDALGHRKISHRKDTRELVDSIGSIRVRTQDGVICNVGISKQASYLRDTMKWDDRHTWVGTWVEIHFQEHGTHDKPRFGAITRLRPDKD